MFHGGTEGRRDGRHKTHHTMMSQAPVTWMVWPGSRGGSSGGVPGSRGGSSGGPMGGSKGGSRVQD